MGALELIAAILIIFWAVGYWPLHITNSLIHVMLIVAVTLAVISLIRYVMNRSVP